MFKRVLAVFFHLFEIMPKKNNSRFGDWLLKGVRETEGPHEKEGTHQQHP